MSDFGEELVNYDKYAATTLWIERYQNKMRGTHKLHSNIKVYYKQAIKTYIYFITAKTSF